MEEKKSVMPECVVCPGIPVDIRLNMPGLAGVYRIGR